MARVTINPEPVAKDVVAALRLPKQVNDVATVLGALLSYHSASTLPARLITDNAVVEGMFLDALAENVRYKVAASDAVDHHLTTDGGVKLYVVPDANRVLAVAFGLVSGGDVDNQPAIQLAENAAAALRLPLHFPSGSFGIQSKIIKAYQTSWYGAGGNRHTVSGNQQGTTIAGTHDGTLVEVTAPASSGNIRSYIKGIRFGNSPSNLNSIAIHFVKVDDCIVEDCFMLNVGVGIRVDAGSALYCIRNWIAGKVSGIQLRGGSDHWIIETQSAGTQYGLHIGTATERVTSVHVVNSRCQSSGVANIYAQRSGYLKIHGGYCDTAVDQGGIGIIIENGIYWSINDVTFYAQGRNAPNIEVIATGTSNCFTGIISNCMFERDYGSPDDTEVGVLFTNTSTGFVQDISVSGCDLNELDVAVQFTAPTNGGSYRRISILGNNLATTQNSDPGGNNAAMIGAEHVSATLVVSDNIGRLTAQSDHAVLPPVGTTTMDGGYPEAWRITGTVTENQSVILPLTGNYPGRKHRIYREDAGAGAIRIYSRQSAPTELTSVALSRSGTTVTAAKVAHGLRVGQLVTVGGSTAMAGDRIVATTADADTFTFSVADAGDTSATEAVTVKTIMIWSLNRPGSWVDVIATNLLGNYRVVGSDAGGISGALGSHNPGSLATGGTETVVVSCVGAHLGARTRAEFALDLQGMQIAAHISADDEVTVRFTNLTADTINLTPGNLYVTVPIP